MAWCNNKTTVTGVKITIKVADGTYSGQSLATFSNKNSVIHLSGNKNNPENVVLNFATGQGGVLVQDSIYLYMEGIKFVGYSKSEWYAGVSVQWSSSCYVNYCIFENFAVGTQSYNRGHLFINNSTINNCVYGAHGAQLSDVSIKSSSITNITTGVVAEQLSRILYNSCTFTGNGQNTYTSSGGTIQSY